LKKDIESWRGGWIIINDGLSTTSNKEISMILSFDFGAADHVFVQL
jgi:hypothetical protein